MTKADDPAPSPPRLVWTDAGTPRAIDFDDVYFSDRDGPGETAHVFHAGNGLPDRWRGRTRFAIGELGFGVGLNFLTSWALWDADGDADRPTLDYVAFELHPPSSAAIAQSAARWTDLSERAHIFLQAWRAAADWPPPPGWTSAAIADGLMLHLAIGDANALLPAWSATAPTAIDAWFLDGFSPAKNPELWGAELLAAVGARTASGGTAASYTAAGWVRRNLAAAGFDVAKTPGFGSKREMLTARKRNGAHEETQPHG